MKNGCCNWNFFCVTDYEQLLLLLLCSLFIWFPPKLRPNAQQQQQQREIINLLAIRSVGLTNKPWPAATSDSWAPSFLLLSFSSAAWALFSSWRRNLIWGWLLTLLLFNGKGRNKMYLLLFAIVFRQLRWASQKKGFVCRNGKWPLRIIHNIRFHQT